MHTKHEGKSVPVDAMKVNRQTSGNRTLILTLTLVGASGQILIPAPLWPLVL